jgi:hypothetical protein
MGRSGRLQAHKTRVALVAPESGFAVELRGYQERLESVMGLSSDYYWEQDENFRFTQVHHSEPNRPQNDPDYYPGKTSWER